MSPKPSQRDVKLMFLSCSKRNNMALTIQTKYRVLEMQAFPLLRSPDSGKHAKFLRKRRNPASHVKYKTEIAIENWIVFSYYFQFQLSKSIC